MVAVRSTGVPSGLGPGDGHGDVGDAGPRVVDDCPGQACGPHLGEVVPGRRRVVAEWDPADRVGGRELPARRTGLVGTIEVAGGLLLGDGVRARPQAAEGVRAVVGRPRVDVDRVARLVGSRQADGNVADPRLAGVAHTVGVVVGEDDTGEARLRQLGEGVAVAGATGRASVTLKASFPSGRAPSPGVSRPSSNVVGWVSTIR